MEKRKIPPMIWVYWWDGFDSAPEIVKACISSIRQAAGDVEVILLDKNNYSNYVQLPNDIIKKHTDGIIGHAHYSDIVRLSLLAEYGGLWMDATLYCSRKLPDDIWNREFYTCKQENEDSLVPSKLRWAGWLLGGAPDFPLFSFARDLLIAYWRRYDAVIDYLLMDYVFDVAYETLPEVKAAIDLLPSNNPKRHQLMKHINEQYRPEFFEGDETFVYKLSYRYGSPKRYTSDGFLTFYGFLTQSVHEKHLLVISGPIAPLSSTNANLMHLIAGNLQHVKVCWLSIGPYPEDGEKADLGQNIDVIKYSTRTKTIVECPSAIKKPNISRQKRFFSKLKGRVIDRNGFGEGMDCLLLSEIVNDLCSQFDFDTIFASVEPFSAGFALGNCKAKGKKALYLIDPPATIVPGLDSAVTPLRKRHFYSIIQHADLIFTTNRIRDALAAKGISCEGSRFICDEFPLIAEPKYDPQKKEILYPEGKINLLYCGWLRNAEFFSRIIEKLDEHFCVTFLGNDNESIENLRTKAELRTFRQVNRAAAIDAILDADILVCIGNPYPVHIPSKTFDYISSGKPVILFYSISDCPAFAYFNKYPVSLCISDQTNVQEALESVMEFSETHKGKHIAWETVQQIYADKISDNIICRITENLLDSGRGL